MLREGGEAAQNQGRWVSQKPRHTETKAPVQRPVRKTEATSRNEALQCAGHARPHQPEAEPEASSLRSSPTHRFIQALSHPHHCSQGYKSTIIFPDLQM